MKNTLEIFSLYTFWKFFLFSAKLKVHFYVSKRPRIKKTVLQNVFKIEFYFQIYLRQASLIFSRISPYSNEYWHTLHQHHFDQYMAMQNVERDVCNQSKGWIKASQTGTSFRVGCLLGYGDILEKIIEFCLRYIWK